MRLSQLQLEAMKKPKQVKAKSKKPKIVKPNKGGSSKHPYQGSLVGESSINTGMNPHRGKYKLMLQRPEDKEPQVVAYCKEEECEPFVKMLQAKMPDAKCWCELQEAKDPKPPKQNNPVAKHSRNMPGAGAHKSAKDYDRKNKRREINKQLDEAPLVMPFASANHIALEKTSKWLQSHYSKKDDRRVEAYKKLGKLVGFDVEPRGENIVFKKFFTQTEDNKN